MRARLRYCHYQATMLRYELEQLQTRAEAQCRRQWAAGVLLAALLPTPDAPPLVPALAAFPPRDAAKDARPLNYLAADTDATSVPTPVARQLLALRLRLLETEAAELATLLPE